METKEIDAIVRRIAERNLSDSLGVEEVASEPTIDSQGNEALRVVITIQSSAAASESGDALLKTLFQIKQELDKEGEYRFPIIEYSTREELENLDDSES